MQAWKACGSQNLGIGSKGMSEPCETDARFVLCVRNKNYPASLELRKVYRLLNNTQAARHGHVRIIDESSEDYLYPEECFAPTASGERVLARPKNFRRDAGEGARHRGSGSLVDVRWCQTMGAVRNAPPCSVSELL